MFLSIVLLMLTVKETVLACDNTYYQGVPDSDVSIILKKHNDYRNEICKGDVDGQPKAKNMTALTYDDKLAVSAKAVSDRCIFGHLIVPDPRWKSLGQNIYKECSAYNTTTRNWGKAIDAWFNENEHYEFGVGSTDAKAVGHYTQLVWATTIVVGCDYVNFFNASDPIRPFTKMYTCNYGPPGNVIGKLPYAEDKDGSGKC